MYILNEAKTDVINSEFIERFAIVRKPDATLIVASYGAERCTTIARYADVEEARKALNELFGALATGQMYFDMPESRLYAEQIIKKDARTKRRGSS